MIKFTMVYNYVYLGALNCGLKRQDEEKEYFEAESWEAAKDIAREKFKNALPNDYNVDSFFTSINLYPTEFKGKKGDVCRATFADSLLCKRARDFFLPRERLEDKRSKLPM